MRPSPAPSATPPPDSPGTVARLAKYGILGIGTWGNAARLEIRRGVPCHPSQTRGDGVLAWRIERCQMHVRDRKVQRWLGE